MEVPYPKKSRFESSITTFPPNHLTFTTEKVTRWDSIIQNRKAVTFYKPHFYEPISTHKITEMMSLKSGLKSKKASFQKPLNIDIIAEDKWWR